MMIILTTIFDTKPNYNYLLLNDLNEDILIFSICNKNMLPKRDWATFNIRKVQRKGQIKQPQQFGLFTPEHHVDKYTQMQTFTNPKRQKQLLIDYSVNEAILGSKAYGDLKQTYNESKYRNAQKKKMMMEEVEQMKKQKQQAEEEEARLNSELKKYEELLNGLKERIIETRNKNRQIREMVQVRMNNQAEYISNMLISMRFQAQYDHDINPDEMTYEQLLELEEKIGCVSKGLPEQSIAKLPIQQLEEDIEDQCTVCFCGMEKGEVIQILPCEHKFHQGCLKGWLVKEKVCPLCKRQIVIK